MNGTVEPVLQYKLGERWITIGGGTGKGTHVKIDDHGNIQSGPKGLKGRNLGDLGPKESDHKGRSQKWHEKHGKADKSGSDKDIFRAILEGRAALRDLNLRTNRGELSEEERDELYDPINQRVWELHDELKRREESGEKPAKAEPKAAEGDHGLGPGVQKTEDGRLVGPTTVDVDQLTARPDLFQYKVEGIGEDGVTDALKDVEAFRPEFAGQLQVWHDPEDGQLYVINGHHRFELAKRTGYGGKLSAYLIDAKDWKEARALGALANIASGHGTALDAASFMRDTGTKPEDLKSRGVSLKGKVASDGVTLAKLSDSIFKKVAGGAESTNRALAIARHVDDHKLQDDLYSEVQQAEQRGRSLTDGAIEEMAREVAAVPTHTETHRDLFGDFEETRSLRPERAILKSGIRKALSSRARAFTEVSRRGRDETLAEAGNVLDTEKNKQLAQQSNDYLFTFDKLANYKGDVSDAINDAAQQLAESPRRQKQILDELIKRVQPALDAAFGGATGPAGTERQDYARARPAGGLPGGSATLADRVRYQLRKRQIRSLLAERLKYAQDGEGRWVTIGGSPGEKGNHEGGQPVKIDSSGKVLAGPKWLADKGITDFGKPGPDHETGEQKPAGENPKPEAKALDTLAEAKAALGGDLNAQIADRVKQMIAERQAKMAESAKKTAEEMARRAQPPGPRLAKNTIQEPSPQEQLDRLKKADAILRDTSMSPRGKLKPLMDLGYTRGEAMGFFDPYSGTPDGIPPEVMKEAEQNAMQYAAGFKEKDHPRDPMGLFVEADQSWRNVPKQHKSLPGQRGLFEEVDVTSHEEKVDRQKSAQKTLFSAKQQLYAAIVERLKYTA